jgi:hypothetical protein
VSGLTTRIEPYLWPRHGGRSTAPRPPYSTFWDTEIYSAGTHTITATATDTFGGVGTSPPVSVTVDNSHPANLIAIDKQVFVDGTGTMTTPAFSTTTDSELLIAFVAIDGPSNSPQTATVSGAGLKWTLLKRSNTQAGDSEMWAAMAPDPLTNATVIMQPGVGTGYHGTLVVIAFTNAAGGGMVNQTAAPSGAPDIYIPGGRRLGIRRRQRLGQCHRQNSSLWPALGPSTCRCGGG